MTAVTVTLKVEDISRLALNRRYRMLPHFYTLFYKSHTTGVPVMTPIFFAGISSFSFFSTLFAMMRASIILVELLICKFMLW